MHKNQASCARHVLIMCSSLAAMSVTAPMVWAQTASNSKRPPTDAKENATGATAAKNDKPQVAVTGGTISLHLEQIPAQEAFRLIAKQTGVSIVFSTNAHRRIVNVSLSDVSVEVAIQEVARSVGLLSVKSGDNTYIIVDLKVEPTLRSPIPSFVLPPRVLPQQKVTESSGYALRMFGSQGEVDTKFSIIMRGSAQFDSKFVVKPPPLNLDGKLSPRTFVMPRGGRDTFRLGPMLPIPNRGLRRYDLPKSSNLLKLPQLKPGSLSGLPSVIVPDAASKQQRQPQPNAPQHRQQQP